MTAVPSDPTSDTGEPTGLIDLAGKRLGGMVLTASDEFFAAKENLLDPNPPVFDPMRFSDRGKEMDGWETRRRRGPGSDWCIIRLGIPGVLEAVMVDTSWFTGNYPQAFTLEGCVVEEGAPDEDTEWFVLRDRTDLHADALQRFSVKVPWRATHVRFWIHPDGGVARLRLLGWPLVDLHRATGVSGRLDLAAAVNGGQAVACTNAHYSSPHNLVHIGDGRDMADGWETRRRRGPGHDWAIIQLATTGIIERVEIDTTNFKGNYPDRCAIDIRHSPGMPPAELVASGAEDGWAEAIPPTPMQPHARHVLDIAGTPPATHLRLRIIPDGGVARLRAFGAITEDGWNRAGVRMLNAMAPPLAAAALRACCGSDAWVAGMVERQPYDDIDALLEVADEVWQSLDPADWLEAFAAHPRIGERAGSRWSTEEQAGTATADPGTLEAIADLNARYEERFGHVFLIRAAGRSAEEMRAALAERLGNDPDTELGVAAEQQRQITGLRLQKLIAEGSAG